MKAQQLPEQYKFYTIVLTDKSKHHVTGAQKESILRAKEQFLELESGTVINKAHIVAIHFQKEATVDAFKSLPDVTKQSLTSSINLL